MAIYSIVSVVLVLTMVEIGTRLYYAVRGGSTSPVDLHAYWVHDAASGYALQPGYAAAGIRVNTLGFRGPELDRSRWSAVQRVIALGDSTTFGPRERECAYPYLLPDLLRPRQVEVVNAGIEGYRSDRALVHLERDVLPLRPDLVTVLIGWNDLYQTDPRTDTGNLALQTDPLQRVLAASAVAQTARRAYFERLQPLSRTNAAPDLSLFATYRPGGYGERLRRILQAVRTAGADALVFTWPTILDARDAAMPEASRKRVQYPYYIRTLTELQLVYADYQAVLRQVAADENVPVIDVAAAFDSVDKGSVFTDTMHFSCDGHVLFARAVAPSIAARLSSRPHDAARDNPSSTSGATRSTV